MTEIFNQDEHLPHVGTDLAVPAGGEVATVHAVEVAVSAGTEVVRDGADPEWYIPSADLVKRPAEGVFLGAIPNADGWGSKYVDDHDARTEDGFVFGVSQASYGFTGVYATPAEGYSLEALRVDHATGLPTWEHTDPNRDNRIMVSGDWGRMGTALWDQLMKEGFGNPGGQVGVIRVTGPDGATKYFAMGADFQGREDNWQVTGSYAEVQPHNPAALEGMNDGSNLTRVDEAAKAIEAAKPQPRNEDDYYVEHHSGHRVSPDPLFERRTEIRDQATTLLDGLRSADLAKLQAQGLVVERTDSWRRSRGLRLYEFEHPMPMSDGRTVTMELELPAGEGDDVFWGLKLKMAWDQGLRSGDRGYTEVDIMSIPASEYSPARRVSPSAHIGSGGWHSNAGLNQHHSNSMYQEVSTVGQAVSDARSFIDSLIGIA